MATDSPTRGKVVRSDDAGWRAQAAGLLHMRGAPPTARENYALFSGLYQHGSASDTKTTQIYEGTNQIRRIVMARQLLKA